MYEICFKIKLGNKKKKKKRVKSKESEKKDKYLDLARELKKQWNIKVTAILIVIGALSTVTKGTRIEGLGNERTNGDHPDYYIFKIGQNTEKSPGDLRRLVTQTQVEDY